MKTEIKSFYIVNFFDIPDGLGELIENTYGLKNIEIISDSMTGYAIILNINKEERMDPECSEVLENIISNGNDLSSKIIDNQLWAVMTDLCSRDIIPSGNYIINFS